MQSNVLKWYFKMKCYNLIDSINMKMFPQNTQNIYINWRHSSYTE